MVGSKPLPTAILVIEILLDAKVDTVQNVVPKDIAAVVIIIDPEMDQITMMIICLPVLKKLLTLFLVIITCALLKNLQIQKVKSFLTTLNF